MTLLRARHVGYLPAMRIITPALATVCCTIALAGCFTTSADYQNDAEEFILTNDDLAAAAGTDDDPLVFESATCEKPESQDAGTTFSCSAIDELARAWMFEVEIQAESTYVVNVAPGGDPRFND